MFCTKCGVELKDTDRFCSQCSSATGRGVRPPVAGNVYNRMTRPREDRKIAGVCAGIARYMGVDVTLIRVLMIVLAIWPPAVGLIVYLVCWAVMPNDPLLLPAPALANGSI
jgi:phage shock protein C